MPQQSIFDFVGHTYLVWPRGLAALWGRVAHRLTAGAPAWKRWLCACKKAPGAQALS